MDAFLTARLDSLTPPDQWPQLPEAAQLLAAELLAGKKLAVWGDYDVDGVCSTALMVRVLYDPRLKPGMHRTEAMPIVHKIIQGHGGAIRVKSQVGKGTTFFVELPIAQKPAAKAA